MKALESALPDLAFPALAALVLALTATLALPFAGEGAGHVFHGAVHLLIVIACGMIFTLMWSARRSLSDGFLPLLGVAYLFVGLLHFASFLTPATASVSLPPDPGNVSGLWDMARLMEAASLLAAFAFLKRPLPIAPAFVVYTVVFVLAVSAVHVWDLTLPVSAATPSIVVLLLAALALFRRHQSAFDASVLRFLVAAAITTLLAALALMLTEDRQGVGGTLGHILTLLSYYYMCRAVLTGSLPTAVPTPQGVEKAGRDDAPLPIGGAMREQSLAHLALRNAAPAVLRCDPSGEIRFINKAAARLLGREPESLLGRPIGIPAPDWTKTPWDAIVSTLEHRPSLVIETAFAPAQGPSIPVEARLERVTFEDRPLIYCFVTDITQRRMTERNLRASEARFRAVSDNAPDAIFIHDRKGRFIDVNRQAAVSLGYGGAELLGMGFADIDLRWNERAFARLLERAQRGHPATMRGVHRRKNGESFPVEMRVGRFQADPRAQDEELFIAMARDITHRMRLEEEVHIAKVEVETAHRAAARMLDAIDRDVRGRINAIIGFSETMRGDAASQGDKSGSGAEDILETARDVLATLDGLKTLAGNALTPAPLTEESADLGAIAASCITMKQGLAADMGIALRTTIAPGRYRVYCDAGALRQVMLNLLSNALKFTPPGGRVEISAEIADDGFVLCHVSDTGQGMSEESIRRALHPLDRIEDEAIRERSRVGLGIGLPLTRSLMTMNGGSLLISSTPGQGAVATLRFPPERRARGATRPPQPATVR